MKYICMGSGELKNQPENKKGMEIICPHCGQLHKIKYGTDVKTGIESDSLSYYICSANGKLYLSGIRGKSIMGIKKGK